jgi:hypothetical protein
MTSLVYVTDVTEEVYPVTIQDDDIQGQGMMTRDELEAMLPKDAQLQEGHYDISGDVAKWLGFELPEGLLD